MKNILIPETEAVLTPQEYVKLVKEHRQNIESVGITPPTLGRRGFGRISVKWKHPLLRRDKSAKSNRVRVRVKLDKVG